MIDLVIVGAGGQARETRSLLNELNQTISDPYNFIGYVVSDLDDLGKYDSKNDIIGNFSFFSNVNFSQFHNTLLQLSANFQFKNIFFKPFF